MSYFTIPISSIRVSDRQRKEVLDDGDFQRLKTSIERRGLINPILVRPLSITEWQLVAGERRLTACKAIGWEEIPATTRTDISVDETFLLELEENILRSDLPWQDQVRAIQAFHKRHQLISDAWSQSDTADCLNMSEAALTTYLSVARHAERSPEIFKAQGITQAKSVVARQLDRAMSTILDNFDEALTSDEAKQEEEAKPLIPDVAASIIQEDFLKWSSTYEGPRFNLLHCDFPYGVSLQDSDFIVERYGDRASAYNDKEEVYWQLLNSFHKNHNRFLSSSAHVVFWFSMKFYAPTLHILSTFLDVCPHPLIWHKSDNKGILSDPSRRPRHVYETAFLCSRGDRKIVRAVSDHISAPTSRGYHLSIKPVPVLKHFFQMLVDENTTLLDPTSGSGSSLRAAEDLGANRVLGIEMQQGFVTESRHDLHTDRVKRAMHATLRTNGAIP